MSLPRTLVIVAAVLYGGGGWLVRVAVVPEAFVAARADGGPTQTTPAASPAARLPRCDRPEHRQFDYWVGEWDVRAAGTPETAPTPPGNVIRLEDGGCVVTEHWTTPRMSARSVNIFDRSRATVEAATAPQSRASQARTAARSTAPFYSRRVASGHDDAVAHRMRECLTADTGRFCFCSARPSSAES